MTSPVPTVTPTLPAAGGGFDAAVWVAVLALLFTVSSFWWMNARRGRLHIVGEPRSFALATTSGLILNIPLVFTNSGPTPVVAINVRLRFADPALPETVPFEATRPGVQPRQDDVRPMATALVLTGHETRVICCEFIDESFTGQLTVGTQTVVVEALEQRSLGKAKWRSLLTFPLRVTQNVVANQASYVAHDNAP